MRRVRLAAVIIGTALATAAGAVPFNQVDVNRDGLVSYQEARPKMFGLFEVHFYKCDLDGDGLLNQSEFAMLDAMYAARDRAR